MKNQLLEDLDDSQSRPPAVPVRRGQAVPPQQPPSEAQAAQFAAPVPSGTADTPVQQRAGVWRNRGPAAPPPPKPQHHGAWKPRPPAPPEEPPAPTAEIPPAAPRISPETASFSSREPDWSVPLQPETTPWTERWGRKALGWTLGLAAGVAVAATAAWMYRDTQVESTLAVVADHSPAQAVVAAPAVPAAAPALPPEPEAAALPPLKLLPPDPVAAAPAAAAPDVTPPVDDATSAAVAAVGAAAPLAAVPVPDTAPPVKKPALKRAPERRVAAAPEKRKPPAVKKAVPASTPKPARERVLARAPAVPARTAPPSQPDPESPLAETLRLCRAAGYHATACLKRGCEATRFGLVCRG